MSDEHQNHVADNSFCQPPESWYMAMEKELAYWFASDEMDATNLSIAILFKIKLDKYYE